MLNIINFIQNTGIYKKKIQLKKSSDRVFIFR